MAISTQTRYISLYPRAMTRIPMIDGPRPEPRSLMELNVAVVTP